MAQGGRIRRGVGRIVEVCLRRLVRALRRQVHQERTARKKIGHEKERLEKELSSLRDTNQALEQKNRSLEEENERLRKLLCLEAPETPVRGRGQGAGNKASAADEGKDPYRRAFGRGRRKKRWKKPGRKPGHVGSLRPLPDHVDVEKPSTLDRCPIHGEPLGEPIGWVDHLVEEIVPVKPTVTNFRRARYLAPCCGREIVAPPHAEDLLPSGHIGPNALLIAIRLKYEIGMSYKKVCEIFAFLFNLRLSAGGLAQAFRRTAILFRSEYLKLIENVRRSSSANLDETGWWVAALRAWAWVAATGRETVYLVRKHRSGKVVREILGEEYGGVLGSDFYSAYGAVASEKQKCLVHVNRDLEEARERSPRSRELKTFARNFNRILNDGVRLKQARPSLLEKEFERRFDRLETRLVEFAVRPYRNPDCRRLGKRLTIYWDQILTFVRHDGVDYHNNRAEREIRPMVVQRKISGGNWSWNGAATHEVLLSLLCTCRKRGQDFIEFAKKVIAQKCNPCRAGPVSVE